MSCLFDSLSRFANIRSDDLRQCICDFLETNPKLTDDMTAETVISHESEIELKSYVFRMRQYSTMGGATEIKAFCIIFKKNVKVKSEPNNRIIEFIVNNDYPYIWLRWTGGHYDPLLD